MPKQLYRSRKNRMIGGVAGGIAEYFDIDPVIVRAVFIVAVFGWGFSILAYIILWIIIPDEEKVFIRQEGQVNQENQQYYQPPVEETDELKSKRRENTRVAGAITLIILGVIFLFNNLTPLPIFHNIWPIVLIALGVYILIKSKNHNNIQEVK